jgi:hypothetical protein
MAVAIPALRLILRLASSVMRFNASTARLAFISQVETAHHVLMLTVKYATVLSQQNVSTVTPATLSTLAISAISATPQCLAATNALPQTCVRHAIMGIIYYLGELVVRCAASQCPSVDHAQVPQFVQSVRMGIFWSMGAVSFALSICRAVLSVRPTLSASAAFKVTI